MPKSRPGSDTGHLDFPSPTEAHHNEKGMYVMNENEGGSVDRGMVLDSDTGLYVPAPPDFKHFRRVFMEKQSLEVEETFEEIEAAIFAAKALDAPDWFSFTDPTFGLTTRVSREGLATATVIVEDFKDLDIIESQQEDYFKSKSMAALNKARSNNHDSENNRRLLRKLQN